MKTNQYESTIKKHEIKPNYLKNAMCAFFFGGLICFIGQTINWIYLFLFEIDDKTSTTYMIVTMILISSILTGFGIYDKFGQVAKAGAFIPITGFANSLTSSALEGKSEGIVLGIASNMFKLAGAVIVVAVVSAFIFGIIRYFLANLGLVPLLDESTVAMIFFRGVM